MDHNAVRATPDCVHRVTVLCAVLCTLSHISDHLGVFGVRSTCAVGPAHAVPHCSTVSYCAVLIPCCAVYVYSPCRRRMVGNAPTPWVLSQIGGTLPIVTMPGDQTKNQVVLHVESPTRPYQDPVLAERVPLVCLAWSGVRLPGVTMSPIWLCAILM